jgi:hypothetical protein
MYIHYAHMDCKFHVLQFFNLIKQPKFGEKKENNEWMNEWIKV